MPNLMSSHTKNHNAARIGKSAAWKSLANKLYRCTRCGKEAYTSNVNDWYQPCKDKEGHKWVVMAAV